MKEQLLKILEECCAKGYDDLHFESDKEFIANAILSKLSIKSIIDDKCLICGQLIPEGRQICSTCEQDKFITKRKTTRRSKIRGNKV